MRTTTAPLAERLHPYTLGASSRGIRSRIGRRPGMAGQLARVYRARETFGNPWTFGNR